MPTVQLFVTCLVDGFAPDVGRAVVTVLERLGVDVEFPEDQGCCGQPAFNAGFADQARSMAASTIAALDAVDGAIVVPSGSCADMLIHHAPRLLAGHSEQAAADRVSVRVRELTQYLVEDVGVTDVGASCAGCTAVFHSSCHGMRNLGIDAQPLALLEEVEGMSRLEQAEPEQCCGFGGLFSVEMPNVSAAIMNTKLDAIEATGADLLIGGDLSCLMHLEGGLRRRRSPMKIRHIAEVLAEQG